MKTVVKYYMKKTHSSHYTYWKLKICSSTAFGYSWRLLYKTGGESCDLVGCGDPRTKLGKASIKKHLIELSDKEIFMLLL